MDKNEKYIDTIKNILKKYPYTFYLFGSRSKKNYKQYSDFDICYFTKFSLLIKNQILEDFENSKLPVLVDLVFWDHFTDEFKDNIKNDLLLLQKGPEEDNHKNQRLCLN